MTGAARIVLQWVVCLTAVTSSSAASLRDVRHLIEYGRYKEAESAAKDQIDRVAEPSKVSLEKAQALDLWVEARWRNGKAWHPGTLEAAQWSESMKREVLGSESAAIADSSFHQARVLDEWARFDQARPLYEQAIALNRRTGPKGDAKAAVAAAYLGGMLVELGQLKAARPHLEESVRNLEAAYGPDSPAVATALVPLAWLEKYSRNMREARSLFERALLIRETTLGPEHPDVAEPLDGLTRLLWETTSLQAGREMGRRAEGIRLKALGPDHPSLVYNYVLLWWTENPSEARICIERALAIAESSLPENHPLLALALNYYAMTAGMNADFSDALPKVERAVRIFETTYGPNHWRVVPALNNLGMQWDMLGETDRAEEVYRRARRIKAVSEVQRFPASDRYEEIELALERGEIDLEEALRRGEEVIEFAQEIDEALFYQGFLFETQADWYQQAGHLAAAARDYEKALEIRTAHSGAGHMHLMDSLRGYADVSAEQGDFDKALRLNRQALKILERQLGPQHLQLLWSMDLEAGLYWGARDNAAAFDSAGRLEAIRREVVRQALTGLPERQSLGFLSDEPLRGQDLMISAAVAGSEKALEVATADTVIRSRGVVLDSLAQRLRGTRLSGDPVIAELDQELGRSRGRLARLAVGGGQSGDMRAHQRRLEEARIEKERAERALASHDRLFSQQRNQALAGLTEVATSLPPQSALVAFVSYERFGTPGADPGSRWPLQSIRSYVALVLGAGAGSPAVVDLGSAEAIDTGVRSLRRLTWGVAETADRSPRSSLASFRREGTELKRLVWDPIAPHLTGAKQIFLVPDGELNLLPFGALPVGESGFLVEAGSPIQYLSAERDLVRQSGGGSPTEARTLLAMGFPDYDEPNLFAALADGESEIFQLAQADLGGQDAVFRGQRATCGDFESMYFAPLPASLSELESIVQSWQQSSEGAKATVLESARANEAAFKAQAAENQVLHLATHGYFLGGECSPEVRTERGQLLENPLVLSGLALAGANHRQAAGPDEEDGILTAEEIAALDLQGVQWAVLSGCETGVGEARVGEGVFGLRRAFQIAGARTIIMSLWPVDDEATRDWMEALYRHRFTDNLSTIDSVHQASLDLLTARRAAGLSTHPFYWAGFVAAGDWH